MIREANGLAEAESLLEELGVDRLPIVPSEIVDSINCPDYRVVIEYKSFDSEQFLGKAEGNERAALIYINSNIPDQGRLNFTAAHEIGHVCMHIMTIKQLNFECGSRELSNPNNAPLEQEANGFASGLLLPRQLVTKLTNGDLNWKNIKYIAESCKASLEATYRRLMLLENKPFALVIHKDGKYKRFKATENFGFFIAQSPLSSEQKSSCVNALTEGFPDEFDEFDAEDWVNPVNKGYSLDVVYASSINLSKGYTYTLITYDDECLNDDDD